MTKTQYMIILKDILNRYTQDAIAKINRIKQILPEKARSVEVGIHPTQDEEGIFSIMIHLIGPDLYVLNKVIEPYRELFGIKFIDAKSFYHIFIFLDFHLYHRNNFYPHL